MEIIEETEDSRDFVTIYKKDFLGKTDGRTIEYKSLSKYLPCLNILNRPYKHYLNTRAKNRLLSVTERSEDPVDYLNRIRKKFPHLQNILPEAVPDEDVVEREEKRSIKTTYQIDYSKENDYHRKDVILPQNWIISETTQKRAYRNPWLIATRELIKPLKTYRPSNNLDPNLKERNILRVTTGYSEYTGTIGIIGEKIKLQTLQVH